MKFELILFACIDKHNNHLTIYTLTLPPDKIYMKICI
jgi:hypothetical protein